MFKQEKERIKRLAYENAKREAENTIRAEKDIMRTWKAERQRSYCLRKTCSYTAKRVEVKTATNQNSHKQKPSKLSITLDIISTMM